MARAGEEIGTQIGQMMGQGEMGLGIMGWRQLTHGWANDPVWLHDGSRQESGQGRVQAPPPPREIRWRAEKGGAG